MVSNYDWCRGQQDTVNAVLRRAAQAHGAKPYLDIQGEVYSYADVDRESSRLAHGLAGLGVRRGQTVVTILDNNVDAVLVWFAINKLGAISVPVNTAYKGEFLRHQVNDAAADVVVAESDYAERVDAIAPGLSRLKTLVWRGAQPRLSAGVLQTMPIEELRSSNAQDPGVAVSPSDVAMLIYTGGTTGPSKGCIISHNYACNLARQANALGRRDAHTINWTPLPLFHMNATSTSILATLMIGARVAVYPRFSVSNFWPEIERTKANDVNLLGSMVPLLAKAPDNESMKRCHGQIKYVGAAPFPAELQEVWYQRFGVGRAGAPGYGLTECAMVVTHAGDHAAPGSSGKRNEWFDVRIVDDEDCELPPGTPGEVIVRPLQPHVMFEGYWNRPADTLKVMKNMWFHTGDIGRFDEQGFFYFVDRKKDYLRRRGENISSFEMETTFRAHPAIQDVAVHAVLSEMTEDDVKVTAVLKPDAKLTEEELCRWSVDRLPYFAVPRYIEFRDELPRNPVGRVLKYELRDQGVTPATWDGEKAGFKLEKR
jgi:crotonobetaine/carnitine-CoA ligase